MAGKRLALLIGNCKYTDRKFFPALTKPAQDVRDLAELLRNPEIGGFDDVKELLDQPCEKVKQAIERFFQKRSKDDLLLLYFSGHGYRDAGKFYLIVRKSKHDLLGSTAVEAPFICDQIDRSASQRKVIILDCCHSGAFTGEKGRMDVKEDFTGNGYGRIVLTAAKATETAQELAPEATIPHSLFTHCVIDGLQTGVADLDQDGKIAAEELFEYVAQQLSLMAAKQTPQIFTSKKHGELVIARNPHWRPSNSGDSAVRLNRITELMTIIKRNDRAQLAPAYLELQRFSFNDPSPFVRYAAQGALEEVAQQQTPPVIPFIQPPSKTPPKPQKTEQNQQFGQSFHFETVTVDAKGKIIKCTPGEAVQQVIELGLGVTLDIVYVPPGTFWMGQTEADKTWLLEIVSKKDYENSYACELPRHEVKIEQGFWMSKYPVTQAQWQAIMGKNPSDFKGVNLPVEMVWWNDCQEFLQKLNTRIKSVETPRMASLQAFRLPSEAEWEYACRAGTTTPFYCGKTITTDLADYDGYYRCAPGPQGKYREKTTDVGSFPPNAFGLYDMHGNVWEWCADPWHDSYEGAPADGSVWEKDGDTNIRSLCGGSWNSCSRDLRCADRSWGECVDNNRHYRE